MPAGPRNCCRIYTATQMEAPHQLLAMTLSMPQPPWNGFREFQIWPWLTLLPLHRLRLLVRMATRWTLLLLPVALIAVFWRCQPEAVKQSFWRMCQMRS